jgi:hypothetical protein
MRLDPNRARYRDGSGQDQRLAASAGVRYGGLGVSLLAALLALAAARTEARAGEPTDGHGNFGRTSYFTLPFAQNVYKTCWSCSPYQEPGQLFFQSNPQSAFNNPATMQTARAGAATIEASGVVPISSQQRWEDTYETTFPAGTFPNEPAWIAADRVSGGYSVDPAFVAWGNFIQSRPQYWDTAFDGGTMPSESNYFRSWGGQWGHISPATPLDAADCPPGKTTCTWGDLFAYRWAQTAALSGAYGVALSDFGDSQPARTSNYHNFNARVIASFAAATGTAVPSGSVASQAQWIMANATVAWNDFLAQSYGAFFSALSTQIGAATGKQSLVIDQCSLSPSYRRWFGTDQRIIAKNVSPANYLCIWDDQQIQVGRYGPVAVPPMQELGGAVLAAAREPLMRNGANIEADDSAYWSAISLFYPTLSASDQTEVGYKLMKRLWLWQSWAHIADRSGKVRRALAFTSRDYWDVGTLTALGPLTTLIQTIYPTQPFGPALYYSTAVERAVEQQQGGMQGVGAADNFYMGPNVLQSFIDKGGVVGYYVSDAALGSISQSQANAPSAWIVLNDQGLMPSSERNQLAAIAPVVPSLAVLAAMPNQPLAFTGGLTGFGFYDQSHRLIIVVSNPSTQPTATALTGTIKLSTLTGTSYTATDLFTNATSSLTVSGGHASLPVTLARWDTRVFALTKP